MLSVEQAEAELRQIQAEQEALDRAAEEGAVDFIEHVRRAAGLEARTAALQARAVEHIVGETSVPDFPPTA